MRQEYGYTYKLGQHDNFGQYWESIGTSSNKVLIFPPNKQREKLPKYWLVALPHDERIYPLIGKDAEDRSFSIAAWLMG